MALSPALTRKNPMRSSRLWICVIAASCWLSPAWAGQTADPTAASLLAAHNRERKKQGRHPLTLSAKLCQAAAVHAKDMALHEKQDHTGSDGSTAADRVKRAGIRLHPCRREHHLGPGYRCRGDDNLDE